MPKSNNVTTVKVTTGTVIKVAIVASVALAVGKAVAVAVTPSLENAYDALKTEASKWTPPTKK